MTDREQRLLNLVYRAFVAGWVRAGGPKGDDPAQASLAWLRGLPDPKDREAMEMEQLERVLAAGKKAAPVHLPLTNRVTGEPS